MLLMEKIFIKYTNGSVAAHSASGSGTNPDNLLLYAVQIRMTQDSHAAKKNPHY
jgi:hypothetical protein